MIRAITTHINQLIATGIGQPDGKYIALAETTWKAGELFPCEIEPTGEAKFVGFDDNYPIVLYHRALNTTYERTVQKPEGFIVSQVRMLMVYFAKRKTLQMDSDTLSYLIAASIPHDIRPQANPDSLSRALFHLSNTNLDPNTVTQREFQQSTQQRFEPRYAKELIIGSLEYNLQLEFKKECIQLCTPLTTNCDD